jgi:hypothetical protein
MLNEAITRNKFMVFLGAGASAPLGFAVMDNFMDDLDAQAGVEGTALLQGIYSAYPMEDGSQGRDLEVVFGTVQRYKDFFALADKDPNFSGTLNQLGSEATTAGEALGSLKQLVFGLDDKIRDLIFTHYGAEVSSDALALYSPLFTELCNLFDQPVVPVFTTNYDAAIETYADLSATPLESGFRVAGVRSGWDATRFHNYVAPREAPALVLFKLHGSVTWYKDAQGMRYVQASRRGLFLENMVIYPGEAKTGMLEEPYHTCYLYLRHCFYSAEYVFVVGYSFRDLLLQRVFNEGALINPGLKFVVINGVLSASAQKRLKDKLGPNVTFIPQLFEAADGAAYLQEIRRLLSPAPEIALAWVGKTLDLVGPGPGANQPDGSPDAVFRLHIAAKKKASVSRIDLQRVDSSGNPTGEHWTTASDGAIWLLKPMDEAGQSEVALPLDLKARQTMRISLVASDNVPPSGWFAAGQLYKATAFLATGQSVSTPPAEIQG